MPHKNSPKEISGLQQQREILPTCKISKAFKGLGWMLLIFYAQPTYSHFANGKCIRQNGDVISIQASRGISVELNIMDCNISDGKGVVKIAVQIGEKTQLLKFYYDTLAYSLYVDSSMDLNNDGVSDLGISNGKGRSGNGMRYWVFDEKSKNYTYIGEAPLLKRTADGENELFATESSSGGMQSIRYNYVVKKGKLTILNALGFIPHETSYEIVLMKCFSDGQCKEVKRASQIPSQNAQNCMSGVQACSFFK